MKNVKQIFFLALLSCAVFSCSDTGEDTSSASVLTPTKAGYSSLDHGNILFKQKSKLLEVYINGSYNYSFNTNVVSSSVTSVGNDITINSPANESIKIINAVRNNGKVTFNLAAYNSSSQNIKNLTGATMDEASFDNLINRGCAECADTMVIALVDLVTYNDSTNSVQKAVGDSKNCKANGGTPELSLEYGFFNNTSVFNCN